MKRETLFAALAIAAIAAYAPAALSYVGPGAGLGMIASLFAMLLAVLATIVGLILWPIRKLRQRYRKPAASDPEPPRSRGSP